MPCRPGLQIWIVDLISKPFDRGQGYPAFLSLCTMRKKRAPCLIYSTRSERQTNWHRIQGLPRLTSSAVPVGPVEHSRRGQIGVILRCEAESAGVV